ncbi:MAG: saccharopine dehydrogenase NADP-binding domain-containing protein [Candidatus Aenigmarchaeota archaeon]|nr:saccharopine dehydrogenase NADP-binding domain-containing protein [Candidatus Aenigmarchaeota archaeon]
MKILILGHGAVGSVLANLLQNENAVKTVTSADLHFKEEKKFGKMHHVKINLSSKSQLADVLGKQRPDLVINASSPKFNADILDECAKAGVNYMDMAACWEPSTEKNALSPYAIEQFDFDKQFRERNILGLIEAGVSPGMTNLFVRECADEFDELDDVKIRLIDYSGSDELHFAWSKEALLDEITSKPLVYENGRFKIMEPFSGEEEYEFPLPYGKKRVNLICQDEIGTIPFFIKLKNIDIKDYDNQVDIHKFLYELGLVSKKKIKFGEIEISPFEFVNKILPDVSFNNQDPKFNEAQFAFSVEAVGKIKNKKAAIRYFVLFPKQKEINKLGLNANFISYPAALSAKIFAMAVPKIKLRGIVPPEVLDKEIRKFVLSELNRTKHVIVKKERLV